MTTKLTRGAPEVAAAPHSQVAEDPNRIIRMSADNRQIAFRKVPLSRRLRIIGLLGAEGGNSILVSTAITAAAIVEIDGEGVAPPTSRSELDVIFDLIDSDDLLMAIGNRYSAEFSGPTVTTDDLKNS